MRLHRLALIALLILIALPARAQEPLRIIAFGAHPDDCDIRSGGVAAKWAALGHKVRFVAVTNGDAGHHEQGGGQLAMRRRAEAIEAGRRIGVDYVVLDNHDGELVPSLDVRQQIIRQIREWKADLVLAPRPNDYHPDHRYTGVLLQDAAFMVTVPNVVAAVASPLVEQPPGGGARLGRCDHFEEGVADREQGVDEPELRDAGIAEADFQAERLAEARHRGFEISDHEGNLAETDHRLPMVLRAFRSLGAVTARGRPRGPGTGVAT